MTISEDLRDLDDTKKDIAYYSKQLRKFRKRKKELEKKITSYLIAENLPGAKYHGKVVLLEEKTQKAPKTKKDRNKDAMKILKDLGIKDTEKVLNDILKARQGEEMLVNKIKIQKYKK